MIRTTYCWLLFLALLTACKDKEEVVDKCKNGFLDPGETGIDCGGNCSPCAVSQPTYFYLECNGSPIVMPTKSLVYQNNTWTLFASNDTLQLQFNMGNNNVVGVYPVLPSGSFAKLFSTFYMNTSNGTCAIYSNDTINHKMSGFFEADFSRTGFNDTIKIRNGQFEFIPY